MRKTLSAALAAVFLAVCLFGCGGSSSGGGATIRRKAVSSDELAFAAPVEGDTIAVFDTSAGEIRAVLYESLAPQACANFIGLAKSGWYDGLTFYRTVAGFCIESGLSAEGASSTIWNGSTYPAEYTDKLHHYAGALCAAMNDSGQGSSVFYFVEALPEAPDDALLSQMEADGWRTDVIDAYKAAGGLPYLDYTDTVFGQVYSGMEVVDAIGQSETDDSAAPLAAVTINSVTISAYGAQ